MKIELEVCDLPPIPLRCYRGWTIEFNAAREHFQCPFLCLFDFDSVKELEKAADLAIKRRANMLNVVDDYLKRG